MPVIASYAARKENSAYLIFAIGFNFLRISGKYDD